MSNVVAMRPRARVAVRGERWQGDDPIFFHRRQVKVGTVMVCTGRIDHGATFKVWQIRSYTKMANGSHKLELVNTPRHLSDDVVLISRLKGNNSTRIVSFATLSYSAIWRLA